jgi:hypothetical protein
LTRPDVPGAESVDPEATRGRHRRRRRLVALASGALVAAVAAGGYAAFGGGGPVGRGAAVRLCVVAPSGWQSTVARIPLAPPTLVLTNFRFGRMNYLYGHTDPRLHWPRGGILISVSDWTRASAASMRSNYAPSTVPLSVVRADFAPFEGVRDLGQRSVDASGRLLQIWVQARPTTERTIREANRALAGVRVCA